MVVQGVVRNAVPPDIAPHVATCPVGKWLHLDDAATIVHLDLACVLASCRLFPANSRDPGVHSAQRLFQGRHLAHAAARVRIPLPEPGAVGGGLLLDRQLGLDALELDRVAGDQPLPGVVGLREEQARVELDHPQLRRHLREHVDEHRALLLPRAGEHRALAEALGRPPHQVLGRARLELVGEAGRLVDGDGQHGAHARGTGRSRRSRSAMGSERSPRRSVSSGMTSSGGMFPRFTSGPRWRMNQACWSFCGASKSRLSSGTSCTISSIRPERTSPEPRKMPAVPPSRASVMTLAAPASSSSLIHATHWYGAKTHSESFEPTSERTTNSSASDEISSSLESRSIWIVPSETSTWVKPKPCVQRLNSSTRPRAMAASSSVPPHMTAIPASWYVRR